MKQAYSYLAEHINENKIKIKVNKKNLNYESSKIIYAIIKSRHSNATKYKVYCRYKPNINEVDAIESWYCTCKTGMRTVGVCSHVASVIYYFAHGKYLETIPTVGRKLLSIFPKNEIIDQNCSNAKKSQTSYEKRGRNLCLTVILI